MIRCTKCGHESIDSSKFCRACGHSLSKDALSSSTTPPQQQCSTCTSPLATGAKFCKKCGTAVAAMEVATTISPDSIAQNNATASANVSAQETIVNARNEAAGTPTIAEEFTQAITAEPVPVVDAAPAQQDNSPAQPVETTAGSVCTNCSLPLPANAKFCKACGTPVAPQERPSQELAPEPFAKQAVPAPEVASQPSSPQKQTSPAPQGQSNPPAKSSKLTVALISTAAIVVIVGGVAGYVWRSSKAADTVATTAPEVAQAQSTTPVDIPAPQPVVPAPAQAAPTTTTEPVENKPRVPEVSAPVAMRSQPEIANEVPATPTAKVQALPEKPVHAPKPVIAAAILPKQAPVPEVTQQANPLTPKVAALLAKADGYISSQQFDKAIATAESVLELDPGNTSATATIKRAKTKQMELLKSGSSIE